MEKTVTVTLTMDEARALFNKAVRGETQAKFGEDTGSFVYRVEQGNSGVRKLAKAIMDTVRGTEEA